jgi:hypothetical protein
MWPVEMSKTNARGYGRRSWWRASRHTVRNKAAKVASHDAVPSGTLSLIELFRKVMLVAEWRPLDSAGGSRPGLPSS